mgnify:CR=1 FL=1
MKKMAITLCLLISSLNGALATNNFSLVGKFKFKHPRGGHIWHNLPAQEGKIFKLPKLEWTPNNSTPLLIS